MHTKLQFCGFRPKGATIPPALEQLTFALPSISWPRRTFLSVISFCLLRDPSCLLIIQFGKREENFSAKLTTGRSSSHTSNKNGRKAKKKWKKKQPERGVSGRVCGTVSVCRVEWQVVYTRRFFINHFA